ncbi:MAG TPA: ATP synthase F0 subunit C [Acidobacteriaceae bacterium]|jgi:F-type H+-transporting ATPase subunit c|nr:ATP synthase F0 subunit C [Acidobacteriaceae bacterium]
MKKLQYAFMALAALFMASPAFAQTTGGGSTASSMVPIGAGIGMAIASGLCGIGQGRAAASATEAVARNPGARAGIMTMLMLGLAFMESLALFTFVIIIMRVK